MIVPTRRLLVSYGLVIPILTLFNLFGPMRYLWTAGACFVFLALFDCALASVHSRRVSVALPPLVRFTRGRSGALEMEVTNVGGPLRAVRLGLPLPAHVSSPHESLKVVFPRGASSARVSWPCTPEKRGRFFIDGCHVETTSPLGLWDRRRRQEGTCEVRVYPDLTEEGRQLSALFLNRGALGLHPRRQQGKGREFERLREYSPGDGYDEISWKATAKRHHPVTRLFQIERTQEIYVCVDASRLSCRLWQGDTGAPGRASEGPGQTHFDRFIGASLLLGLAARRQGDLFGMVAFDESVRTFVRASAGNSHYTACRERLANLDPRLVSPDFEELFTFVRLNLRRRSLIMLLTSLDDPLLAESFIRAIELVRRTHLVYVVMLRPDGVHPIFSNPGVASLDGVYEELSGHDEWRSLRELEGTLRSRGVHFTLAHRERLCVDLVTRYIDVKQRQLL